MNVSEILNTALHRNSSVEIDIESCFNNLSQLEGLIKDLASIRVANTSDTQQRLLELMEQWADHGELLISHLKDVKDQEIAAQRLIDKLTNERWKKILKYRYIKQLGWTDVVARINEEEKGNTDGAILTLAAAKSAGRRAIDNLEGIVENM